MTHETREQLLAQRAYLSQQLQWAKESRLWAHAERYLSELDTVNLRLASEQSGDSVQQGEKK